MHGRDSRDADPAPAAGAARLDRLADRLLRRGLPGALAVACIALLAAWLPHYLTWPLWSDPDVFAAMALSWLAGERPYRDVAFYNFPGTIYLWSALIRGFGRGRTAPFYAADAALLIAFGTVLVAWGRRRLGGSLPGLVAALGALAYYLDLDYSGVAQRDWHTPLLACSALLIAQAWPGGRARLASAVAMAAALTIRPHAILFLPALLVGVIDGPRPVRTAAAWLIALAGALALAFAPLALAGVLGEFVANVRRAAYGGPYSRATPTGVFLGLAREVADPRAWCVLMALGLLAVGARPGRRRLAAAWVAMLAGAWLYRPLHPVAHAYLAHPRALVGAVVLGALAALAHDAPALPPRGRLAVVLLALALAIPAWPRMARPLASLRALADLVQGREPSGPPPGAERYFAADGRSPYRWAEYVALLDHLRRTTSPNARIANVLEVDPVAGIPQPALNGPIGRPSPFPVEAGVLYLDLVDPGREGQLAERLARGPDVRVVWIPGPVAYGPQHRYERLRATIRAHYEPEARFGVMAVWRRKDVGP